jgi:hypothetical protein
VEASSGLLVFVPGIGHPRNSVFLDRLRAELGQNWQVRRWEHGLTPWSTNRLEDVAHRLAVRVRTWAGDNGIGEPVDRVVLVGHSVGGLLVRQAFLHDAGRSGQGTACHAWTRKVTRIALLAAPNAGFVSRRLPLWLRVPFVLAAASRPLTVEQLQAGSAFITELRLRWIDAFRAKQGPRPQVVQVLGDRDDFVAVDDSLDVEYMEHATRIDVPGARHGDLADLDGADDPQERYALLRHALFGDLDPDRLKAVPPSPRPAILVLHGIRTRSYANWVGDLTKALTADGSAPVVRSPSYGFFSAVDFALPFTRNRNLRHFLDWYSRLRVEHERQSFAGHSNGTYMLGRALRAVPAIRFDRIYLAGSVLPREYEWTEIIRRGQVTERIHNDQSVDDVPVGWLCAALRGLGMRDVGTAGVFGFDEQPTLLVEHRGFRGGHGAALKPELDDQGAQAKQPGIDHVARFLLGRHDDADPEPVGKQNTAFATISGLAGTASLPLLATGTYHAVRWVRRDDDNSRLVALGVSGAVAWVLGRAV